MGLISADDLRAFCVNALTKVGVGEADARTTADVLVTTDTWGVFTHGVKSLSDYIRRIQAGESGPMRVPGSRRRARPGRSLTAVRPGHGRLDVRDACGDREGPCLRDWLCGRLQ